MCAPITLLHVCILPGWMARGGLFLLPPWSLKFFLVSLLGGHPFSPWGPPRLWAAISLDPSGVPGSPSAGLGQPGWSRPQRTSSGGVLSPLWSVCIYFMMWRVPPPFGQECILRTVLQFLPSSQTLHCNNADSAICTSSLIQVTHTVRVQRTKGLTLRGAQSVNRRQDCCFSRGPANP